MLNIIKNNKKLIGALMLAVLIFSSAALMTACSNDSSAKATEMVYTVYFGLNDADSGTQEVSMDEASAYIRKVIESYGYGYTEYRTYGAYTENGVSKGNDNLVYMFTFVKDDDVKKIADDAIEHLNLASVLYQKEEMEYGFFAGEEKQAQ